MQGYSLRPVEGLTVEHRVRALTDRSAALVSARAEAEAALARVEAEVSTLAEEELLLAKVSELFRMLTDRLVNDQVRAIAEVVSEGLKAIFVDQDLGFEVEVGQKYGKVSIDFLVRSGDPDRGGYRGPPLESFGGGPQSIISLVLRILTLLRLGRAPLILLDETLAAVSDEYIEATGIFLRKLAESAGLDLLLVTHKAAFLEHARVSYRGDAEPDPGGGHAFVVRRTGVSSC